MCYSHFKLLLHGPCEQSIENLAVSCHSGIYGIGSEETFHNMDQDSWMSSIKFEKSFSYYLLFD